MVSDQRLTLLLTLLYPYKQPISISKMYYLIWFRAKLTLNVTLSLQAVSTVPKLLLSLIGKFHFWDRFSLGQMGILKGNKFTKIITSWQLMIWSFPHNSVCFLLLWVSDNKTLVNVTFLKMWQYAVDVNLLILILTG